MPGPAIYNSTPSIQGYSEQSHLQLDHAELNFLTYNLGSFPPKSAKNEPHADRKI